MTLPVNLKMLAHPANWIVILLMLIIAGAAGHMLLSLVNIEPARARSSYENLPAGQSAA